MEEMRSLAYHGDTTLDVYRIGGTWVVVVSLPDMPDDAGPLDATIVACGVLRQHVEDEGVVVEEVRMPRDASMEH